MINSTFFYGLMMTYTHRIFVYGTLQRGQRNHEQYCHGARKIMPACLPGRLYECVGWRYLFPALEIPESIILAHAGNSLEKDHDHFQELIAQQGHTKTRETQVQWTWDQERHHEGEEFWAITQGEYYEFEDPDLTRLQQLDHLEGFKPHHPSASEYLRVVTPVLCEDLSWQLAWIYINEEILADDYSSFMHYPHRQWRDSSYGA